jgi:hypothetical protein
VEALDSDAVETTDAEPAPEILPVEVAERPRLEPADLELALQYLTEFAVIVAADPLDEAIAGVVSAAAAYAGAHVVAIVPPGDRPPTVSATVLEDPPDPDGAFARSPTTRRRSMPGRRRATRFTDRRSRRLEVATAWRACGSSRASLATVASRPSSMPQVGGRARADKGRYCGSWRLAGCVPARPS